MQRNQINLNDRSVEANKDFLRALYGAEDLQNARRWFDKLDISVSLSRQRDTDMSLDKFLDSMTGNFHIMLQTGQPIEDEIIYCASSIGDKTEKFAWVECPYTGHNYGIVSRLFNQFYGQELDSIPVPEGVK